jgi:hypothetical protein
MKRFVLFAVFAWALTSARMTQAIPVDNGKFSVTDGIKLNVAQDVLAKSSSFTIVKPAAVNPAADTSTPTSGAKKTSPVTPPAPSKPGPVAPLLSAISPILTSLVDTPGRDPGATMTSLYNYVPTPVDDGPSTEAPSGLKVFSPEPEVFSPEPVEHSPESRKRVETVSVPDGGATVALLGIGLLGTALMKRKLSP